jgi:hypothetical protein
VLLGGLALALGLWLLRLFATAPVETIRKALIWGAASVAVVLGGVLLLSGRGLQALWAAGLFAPMLWRWWNRSRFNGWFGRGGDKLGTAGPASDQETSVETDGLAMRLDHATGAMSGRVKRGRFVGRELAELALPELLALLGDCRTQDVDAVPLLEAWLDRALPDWRDAEAAQAEAAAPAGTGRMDRAEALAVLGLGEAATRDEIRAAHRRLMQAAHPDHGGSDWLAARVNEARDLLLR